MPVWSFVGTEQSDSNAYNSNVEFFPQLEQHMTVGFALTTIITFTHSLITIWIMTYYIIHLVVVMKMVGAVAIDHKKLKTLINLKENS